MSELEEKLNNILNDPKMMQQIMGMAQMLSGGQQQPPAEEKKEHKQASSPDAASFDPRMLQSLSGILRQGGIDTNQQYLLKALQPYLSRDRISRLERAMNAAKMAGAVSGFLNAGGLQLLSRR